MNYCPERFVAENVAAVFLTLKSCVMKSGGEGGIRTPGTGFSPYNGLANRRIQPLCHLSAANVLQHCNLLPHLVTVPPSVAAFWCTLSPECHQES